MKILTVFLGLIILSYPMLALGQITFLDDPFLIRMLRLFKEFNLNVFGSSGAMDGPFFQEAVEQHRVQKRVSRDTPFPCNVTGGRSKTVPTSVHRLRPGDIDVIGAIGDSLTAGFGVFATNLFHIFIENRGASAFGGGEASWREFLTLPNILKEYNPQLFGYAAEDSFTHQPESQFNIGENLAMSKDLPFMASNLIQRMKNDRRVDMKNHWKLINIFIGANDICSDICYRSSSWDVLLSHKNDLIKTFRLLRDNLPRTMVSLISIPNVKELIKIKDRPAICDVIAHLACSCLVGHKFADRRQEFLETIKIWQRLDEEISAFPEFQRDDFAVLFQKFTTNLTVPLTKNGKTDFNYLSTDCFHPSQRLQAKAALGLWANLLQRPDEKTQIPEDDSAFPCPTEERPYIMTLKNY